MLWFTSHLKCHHYLHTIQIIFHVRYIFYFFISKIKEYLSEVDSLSDQNKRNVMRQVTKLVLGEGIRYDSKAYGWPEGCYFLKGTKVHPTDDILKLMDIGRECEDEWGRDHGNGWLLSHPLKKMYQFQQYHLQD